MLDFNNLLFMEREDLFGEDLGLAIKPRDYKCPCGKTYLSYAALFTHIKQKHDGKVPPPPCSLPERSPNRPLNTTSEDDPLWDLRMKSSPILPRRPRRHLLTPSRLRQHRNAREGKR